MPDFALDIAALRRIAGLSSTSNFLGDVDAATPTNKTFNVAGTGNSLTATSAAVGDILHIASGTSFTRLGLGTLRQILAVNGAATDIHYRASHLPSSARKHGVYWGKVTNAISGMFTAFSTTGTPVANYDSTNGSSTKCPTTASTGNACGIRWIGASSVMTKFNARLYVKFSVDTNTNNRFYIGFNQSGSDWTVGDEPGANAWYIVVGARSTDSVFVIGSNAQSTTGTFVNYNKDGVGGTLALDTAVHTVEINTTTSNFTVQIDNNSVQTITTPIPSSTAALFGPIIDIQTNENVIHNLFVYYAELEVDK